LITPSRSRKRAFFLIKSLNLDIRIAIKDEKAINKTWK
jgi:hypothetical protein